MQLGALGSLADLASDLGRWDEMADRAQRMRVVAQACGAQPRLGHALSHLGQAALGQNDLAAALGWVEQALAISRTAGDRRKEALCMRVLGEVHLARHDAGTALPWFVLAKAANEALGRSVQASEVAALAALCRARLGQPHENLSEVNAVLAELEPDADHDAPPIKLLWACQQVLEAMGDERAAPMREKLFADVQARAAVLTDEADRERLIQSLPDFRDIVPAHGRRAAPVAAH